MKISDLITSSGKSGRDVAERIQLTNTPDITKPVWPVKDLRQ